MTLAESRKNPIATKMMKQALTEPEMEKVNGGYWIIDNPCAHEWVYTGRTREESYFIFWTHTVRERTCKKCGWYCWG